MNKDVFFRLTTSGAKKNILRPHEKSNLRLQIPTKEKSWPSPTKT